MSLRALRIGLRARFLLVSHSRRDVDLVGHPSLRRFVQRTHGVAPKTMGDSTRKVDIDALDRVTRTCAHVVRSSDLEATSVRRGKGHHQRVG